MSMQGGNFDMWHMIYHVLHVLSNINSASIIVRKTRIKEFIIMN
ncbi:Uncharacterised protein [Serratia fonticola]|nr:Uncharacterised protein [Serratia fonticola]